MADDRLSQRSGLDGTSHTGVNGVAKSCETPVEFWAISPGFAPSKHVLRGTRMCSQQGSSGLTIAPQTAAADAPA
jgi:hypothetical protein